MISSWYNHNQLFDSINQSSNILYDVFIARIFLVWSQRILNEKFQDQNILAIQAITAIWVMGSRLRSVLDISKNL